jgi:serine protease Do
VALGKLVTAVNYDLAIFMLTAEETNFLEIEQNVDQNVAVGARIGAPGNAGGASTIGYRFGQVVAIGPELVEINAPIKGGNSGGPILLENGRVVGIVSFFKQETVDDPRLVGAGQRLMVRRFGYRVDNVKSWETPDWQRFVQQGERVARVEATSRDLLTLVDSGFSSWNGNERIGKIMGSFEKNVNAARNEKDAYGDVSKAFSDLKSMTLEDLNAVTSDRSLYWWWKHSLEAHKELRTRLDEAFEKRAAEARQKR